VPTDRADWFTLSLYPAPITGSSGNISTGSPQRQVRGKPAPTSDTTWIRGRRGLARAPGALHSTSL